MRKPRNYLVKIIYLVIGAVIILWLIGGHALFAALMSYAHGCTPVWYMSLNKSFAFSCATDSGAVTLYLCQTKATIPYSCEKVNAVCPPYAGTPGVCIAGGYAPESVWIPILLALLAVFMFLVFIGKYLLESSS